MTDGPTMRVAKLIAGTQLSDISPRAIAIGKDCIYDSVGVALAGRTQPGARKAAALVRNLGGIPEASVWGEGYRTSASAAALANGTSAAILSYDGYAFGGQGHYAGSLVTAALAVAEAKGLSGRDVLEAFLVGFETVGKIGRGIQPAQLLGGFHSTGTLGVLGCAAVYAKLLGFDSQTVAVSLGIAASCAGGIRGNFGSMTKALHTGLAASDGILAASLAAEGFTARPDIIETTYGYAHTTVKNDDYRLDDIGKGWGDPWDLESPGVGLKFQPSGTISHCSGAIARELAVANDIEPRSVASIACRVSAAALDIGRSGVPDTANEAVSSIPWAVAVALTDRKTGFAQFSADRVQDPEVRRLAAMVELSVHPEFVDVADMEDMSAAEVVITLENGQIFRGFRRRPTGYPGGAPWTEGMLDEKFRETAGLSLSAEAVEEARLMLRGIEEVSDIRELTSILRNSASGL